MAQEMKVAELKRRMDAHEPVVVLDVRDPWETELARLDHAVHIPMEEIELRTEELDPKAETVVYCHHGVRSAAVAEIPRAPGLRQGVESRGRHRPVGAQGGPADEALLSGGPA